MSEMLSHGDIRNLLEGFAAAVDSDQRCFDATSVWKFHSRYNEETWRKWRADHVIHINKLIQTVDEIPSAMLSELATVGISYELEVIRRTFLELLAEAVSGSCAEGGLETAELFFGWLICEVRKKPEGILFSGDIKRPNLSWYSLSDPLEIARDVEVEHQPASRVC